MRLSDPGDKFNSLPAGQSATDTFAYIVQDANGGTASGLVTITITGVNQPPVASDVVLTLNENSGANVVAPPLLAAALDPDTGDRARFTISAVNPAGARGQVQLLAGEVLTYNPDGAFPNLSKDDTADDAFEFTVTDGNGGFSTARAAVRIVGINDPPVAGPAAFTVLEHSGGIDLTAGLRAAASDADPGEAASLRIVAIDPASTLGSITISNEIVTYSPNGRFQALTNGQTALESFT